MKFHELHLISFTKFRQFSHCLGYFWIFEKHKNKSSIFESFQCTACHDWQFIKYYGFAFKHTFLFTMGISLRLTRVSCQLFQLDLVILLKLLLFKSPFLASKILKFWYTLLKNLNVETEYLVKVLIRKFHHVENW